MKNKLKLFVMTILVMAMVCSACSGSEPAPAASTEEKGEAVVSSIPEKETQAPATEAPTTEEEDALKWAREMGIIDDSMRDVTQTAVMLWRYHRIYSAEDYKSSSGLLD